MATRVAGKDIGRMLIVRETIDEARQIVGGNPTNYGLMKAVWLADLAVELTLATVISDLNIGLALDKVKKPMFHHYLETISSVNDYPELDSLKLHFVTLRPLHNARNRVHDGQAFSIDSSKKLVGTAELFIQTAFANVYGLNLDRLSLVSFLKPSSARDRLEDAETKIAKKEYSEAMLEVAKALKSGYWQFSKLLKEKSGRGLWSDSLFPSMVQGIRKVSLEEEAIKKIAYLFELSRYGIDVDKAIRYIEQAPEAIGFSEASLISGSGIRQEYSQAEAQEFLSFVADALYRFQSYIEKV